jgi:hypothetical protein
MFVLFLFTVVFAQGVWYIFNFQPSILDEQIHVGMIDLYTNQISPFINTQLTSSDWLGEVTRNPSSLYYFLMSFPLRFIRLLTQDFQTQVLLLRFIHMALFMAGLYMYDKFFRYTGLPKIFSRLVLLFLVLTPSVAVLPGVVNYDNVQFLFSGLLLYQAAILIKKNKIQYNDLLKLFSIIFFGILTKYTFIALVLPVLIVLVIFFYKDKKLKKINTKSKTSILLLALAIVGLILFIERPVQNLARYGNFNANCIELHGEQRCKSNYVVNRNIEALETKSENFKPKSLYEYTVVNWIPNMIRSQVRLNPWDTPSKVLFALYSVSFFGGIALVMIYLRELLKNKHVVLMLVAVLVFSGILLIANYRSYRSLAEVVATSSRYLLPVQPLFMMLVVVSFSRLLKNHRKVLIVSFIMLLISFTFGGGILTYNLTADSGSRWSDGY